MARRSTCNLVIIKGVVCSMSRQLFKNCDLKVQPMQEQKLCKRG